MIENEIEKLVQKYQLRRVYPLLEKEFTTVDKPLLKQLSPLYDQALFQMGIKLNERLRLYKLSSFLNKKTKLSFSSRILKKVRQIDNLIPIVIFRLFELIEGAFSFVCALAWNEVLKENIERNETWSEMTWAWVTMGIFSMVVITLELIKLLFVSEVKLFLSSNDYIVQKTHQNLHMSEELNKQE